MKKKAARVKATTSDFVDMRDWARSASHRILERIPAEDAWIRKYEGQQILDSELAYAYGQVVLQVRRGQRPSGKDGATLAYSVHVWSGMEPADAVQHAREVLEHLHGCASELEGDVSVSWRKTPDGMLHTGGIMVLGVVEIRQLELRGEDDIRERTHDLAEDLRRDAEAKADETLRQTIKR